MKKSRSRPLIGLLSAEFLSLLGNQIAAVAIPLLVLQCTHSPLATGAAGAAAVLPIIFSALIGSRFIDRYGAVRASIAADLMSFTAVSALPLILLNITDISAFPIFILVFLGALFDPAGVTARQILVPGLTRLSGSNLSKINSYRGALENGADLLGPVIGGALISLLGIMNTFFLNAASFLACALIVFLTIPSQHKQMPHRPSPGLLAGIKALFGNPQLKTLTLMGLISSFVLLPFLGLLLPVFITQRFESPMLVGLSLSIFGGAATLGAFSFKILEDCISRNTIYYSGFILTAISMMTLPFLEDRSGIILAAGCSGLLLGAGNPLEQTILQEIIPAQNAGQIFTSYHAIRSISGPPGLLLGGIALTFINISLVFVFSGALLIIMSIYGYFLAPLSNKDI